MSSPAFAYPSKSPEAFRTISEVAVDLGVPQHVLRFWESRFAQVKPVKRAGGRRYYRPEDIDLLKGIRALLYGDGFTIRGVQKVLKEKGLRHVALIGRGGAPAAPQPIVIEKVVFVEKPAQVPVKKRPTHLRAVPDPVTLPLFADEPQPARSPAAFIASMPMPETIVRGMAQEERNRLVTLLAELMVLKTRLRAVRG